MLIANLMVLSGRKSAYNILDSCMDFKWGRKYLRPHCKINCNQYTFSGKKAVNSKQ